MEQILADRRFQKEYTNNNTHIRCVALKPKRIKEKVEIPPKPKIAFEDPYDYSQSDEIQQSSTEDEQELKARYYNTWSSFSIPVARPNFVSKIIPFESVEAMKAFHPDMGPIPPNIEKRIISNTRQKKSKDSLFVKPSKRSSKIKHSIPTQKPKKYSILNSETETDSSDDLTDAFTSQMSEITQNLHKSKPSTAESGTSKESTKHKILDESSSIIKIGEPKPRDEAPPQHVHPHARPHVHFPRPPSRQKQPPKALDLDPVIPIIAFGDKKLESKATQTPEKIAEEPTVPQESKQQNTEQNAEEQNQPSGFQEVKVVDDDKAFPPPKPADENMVSSIHGTSKDEEESSDRVSSVIDAWEGTIKMKKDEPLKFPKKKKKPKKKKEKYVNTS